MLLTTKQVAAKLKISLVRVRNLAKNGHLKDHAPHKDGAEGPAAGTGLLSRLDRIEEKIDRLLAVWS